MPETYPIKLINLPVGAGYLIYINEINGHIVGGTASSNEVEVQIPAQYSGNGKIKVNIRVPARTFSDIHYSVPINIGPDKSNVIDMSQPHAQPDAGSATAPETPQTPPQPVKPGKKLITNKLKQAVAERKEELNTPKTSFWDRLR